ncbi:MAG: thioether cross-link-forming SCIFF peptide maturase [Bacillota bacterium]
MHKFEILGHKYLFEENSNSLHEIDQLIWDILDAPALNEAAVRAHLGDSYPWTQVQEALQELQQLAVTEQLANEPLPEPQLPVGEPLVKALCLHLAHDCNLRCTYCFAGTGPFGGKRELMPVEVGRAALEMLVRTSGPRINLEVDFFGGEPLLNFPVVRELVAYGHQLERESGKQFRFTLTTNCTLLNDEIVEFLNQEKIAVVLSLDGRQEVNDRARPFPSGVGSYERIVPRMQQLVASRNNDNYYVRGTYTRHNLDFAADARHMVELGFDVISLEPVVGSPEMDYTLRPEDLPQLEAEYEKLADFYVQRYQAGKPFSFFHFNISLDHGPCLIKRVTGCGAGYDYLAVAPNGDLYPCHQFVGLPQFKMGSVQTGLTNLELSQQLQAVNLYQKDECVDCWARFFCSGGCTANAWFTHGDFNKPNVLACALQKKRLECALHVQAQTKWAEPSE